MWIHGNFNPLHKNNLLTKLDLNKWPTNARIYRVGGYVRDSLLGFNPNDTDWVVVGVNPEQMLQAGFKAVGKDFPVFLHPLTHDQYALARTEKKVARGYSGFEFNTSPDITLEQDLLRRDLTINSMALSDTGEIIDPHGGQEDLKNRIIRHTSSAFAEDPLRVIRVAKFNTRLAPLGFNIAQETLELMRKISLSGELASLTSERVWQETMSIFEYDKPSVFFETLKQCDALDIIFPEIFALYGKPQPEIYHPEIDSGIHTMMVLDRASQLSSNVLVRFAALCHDLGKGDTPIEILPSHRGHEQRGVQHVKNLSKRFSIAKKMSRFAQNCCYYHTHLHKLDSLRPLTILKMMDAFSSFHQDNLLQEFSIVCQSDAQGRLGFENIEYPNANKILALQKALNDIDLDPLKQNYQGIKFKNQLDKLRCAEITRIKKTEW